MVRRVRQMGSRLYKAMTLHTFAALACAGFLVVLASLGLWTHTVYAAKVRAEKVVHKQATTLNQVMAKLNHMESEMQQQNQAMEARLTALRYADAKLASYALRTAERADMRSAHLEEAVARAPRSAMGGGGGGVKVKLNKGMSLTADLCGHVGLDGGFQWEAELEAKGHAEGGVGADVAGDGAKASVKGDVKGAWKADIAPGGGLSMDVCWNFPSLAFSQTSNTTALQADVTNNAQAIANKVAALVAKYPKLGGSALPNALDALNNFKAQVTPQAVIQAVEAPAQTMNNFKNLLQNVPLPGNLSTFVSNPAAFMPQLKDLKPGALCADADIQGTGILYNICNNYAPNALENLDTVSSFAKGFTSFDFSNFTSSLSNLQSGVSSLESGVTSVCTQVNGDVSTLENTSLTVQKGQLANFTFVSGLSPTTATIDTVLAGNVTVVTGVTPDYTTIGVPPNTVTVSVPFSSLPTVQCPSF